MSRLVLTVLLFLVWVSLADAATKYVCPVEGTYGSSNGSDLTNCFDGPYDIWSTGAPSSGDTVIICGTHRIPTGGIGSFTIQVNMTYTLGSTADCGAVGRGTVYGSVRDDGTTGWTFDAPNNAYKKSYAGEVFLVARMTAGENPWQATILTNVCCGATATTLGNMTTGQWFWDTTAGGTLWLKEDPAGVVHEVGQGTSFITLYDVASITDSTVMGGETACTGLDTDAAGFFFINHIGFGSYYDSWAGRTWGTHLIKNVRMFGGQQGVHAGGGSGNSEFTNLTVQDSCFYGLRGEGAYVDHMLGGTFTYQRNIVGDATMQASGWGCESNSAACGDAIDYNPPTPTLADNSNALITDNIVTNIIGHCLTIAGGGTWTRNVCIDVGNTGRTNDAAMNVTPNSTSARPTILRGNIVDNRSSTHATHGMQLGCNVSATNSVTIAGNIFYLPLTSTSEGVHVLGCNAGFTILNNTFVNGTYGIRTTTDQTLDRTSLTNNIFTGHQFPLYMINTTLGSFTAKNNFLWPTSAQANPILFANTAYASKTALESAQSSWTGNLQDDPLLTSAGKTTAASPARGAGLARADCLDARGRVCPPDAPNIGAYQSTSGDPAATRTTRAQ